MDPGTQNTPEDLASRPGALGAQDQFLGVSPLLHNQQPLVAHAPLCAHMIPQLGEGSLAGIYELNLLCHRDRTFRGLNPHLASQHLTLLHSAVGMLYGT